MQGTGWLFRPMHLAVEDPQGEVVSCSTVNDGFERDSR